MVDFVDQRPPADRHLREQIQRSIPPASVPTASKSPAKRIHSVFRPYQHTRRWDGISITDFSRDMENLKTPSMGSMEKHSKNGHGQIDNGAKSSGDVKTNSNQLEKNASPPRKRRHHRHPTAATAKTRPRPQYTLARTSTHPRPSPETRSRITQVTTQQLRMASELAAGVANLWM